MVIVLAVIALGTKPIAKIVVHAPPRITKRLAIAGMVILVAMAKVAAFCAERAVLSTLSSESSKRKLRKFTEA